MSDGARGSIGEIGLVARREIVTRANSKAFRITTIVMVVVVVGFIVVLKLIGGPSGSKVGFAPSVMPLAAPLQSVATAVGQTVTTSQVDAAAGEQQVRDGTLDAFVTGSPEHFQVVVLEKLPDALSGAFSVLARQVALNQEITRLGGDPAAVSAAVAAAAVDVRPIGQPREYQGPRIALGVIVGILVYVSVMLYGQLVAQGVVEEKSSRIVELLLTTIRPWQLMVGKVLGIGAVGLAQLVLVAVVGIGTGVATKTMTFPTELATGAAFWAIAWFLLGYLAYALIFAGLGALVSRQEDVGGVTAPAIMMLVLPYVLGISILPADPTNRMVATLSLIPLFSPMLMPMRIALGVAPVWQVVLSVVLTMLLILVLVWLAGRIYRNAVLRMGSRVKFTEALRAA